MKPYLILLSARGYRSYISHAAPSLAFFLVKFFQRTTNSAAKFIEFRWTVLRSFGQNALSLQLSVLVMSSIDNRACARREGLVIPAVMRTRSNYNPDILNLPDSESDHAFIALGAQSASVCIAKNPFFSPLEHTHHAQERYLIKLTCR